MPSSTHREQQGFSARWKAHERQRLAAVLAARVQVEETIIRPILAACLKELVESGQLPPAQAESNVVISWPGPQEGTNAV